MKRIVGLGWGSVQGVYCFGSRGPGGDAEGEASWIRTAFCRTVFAEESMAAPKEARIEARVSPKQKRLFERAAEIEGVTLTDFAISSMQRAAASVVEEYTRIELSERNQRAFVEALMNPPDPNPALREAARAYSSRK